MPVRTDGWIRDIGNGGLYLNKKYIPKKADKGSLSVTTSTGSTAKNFHLIRYADILLWYAEALIETGNHQGAREYVNQVRARAANSYVKAADPVTMEETTSPYVLEDKVNGVTRTDAASNYRIGLYPVSQFSTREGALAALRFERKLEFALEGQRWYDLARWG
ncbi:MAG TPA: RagB/SusD family nutrient uptake outer membrane protein, partial [Porphyromonadaceae bacterium]|nr:RagB/SusD family nutrient uptake outer membrane protein [Porphyromonadaceae bacterium]